MAITTRWWWIRHAPVINTRQELYGHKDLDCHLSDEEALAALADWLPSDTVWVTSHLKRAIATANARQQVKDAAHYITPNPGGQGAGRDAIDFILSAQGSLERVIEQYLDESNSAAATADVGVGNM